MSRHRALKFVHLASAVWFILCISYILILTLRHAGIKWWIVFSLSGHGLLISLTLISLYLFAIFRGVSSSQKVQMEHPLTSTNYYRIFYVITPLLGGLAGCIGMIGISTLGQFTSGVALGTLGMTFFVWVIVDPLTGLLEPLLLPASRKHRIERIARARALRQSQHENRENLLREISVKEKLEKQHWRDVLAPVAEQLASKLTSDKIDFSQMESEVVGIGVYAWQIGGLGCMKELHGMVVDLAEEKDKLFTDYLSVWWDGIGSWQQPALV
ncbi:MAG: hypothetical protein JW837_00850 [Sedimentisphaerales bacterium]|nr:hypothetical protein [Sedimentisphaerales bacterium]